MTVKVDKSKRKHSTVDEVKDELLSCGSFKDICEYLAHCSALVSESAPALGFVDEKVEEEVNRIDERIRKENACLIEEPNDGGLEEEDENPEFMAAIRLWREEYDSQNHEQPSVKTSTEKLKLLPLRASDFSKNTHFSKFFRPRMGGLTIKQQKEIAASLEGIAFYRNLLGPRGSYNVKTGKITAISGALEKAFAAFEKDFEFIYRPYFEGREIYKPFIAALFVGGVASILCVAHQRVHHNLKFEKKIDAVALGRATNEILSLIDKTNIIEEALEYSRNVVACPGDFPPSEYFEWFAGLVKSISHKTMPAEDESAANKNIANKILWDIYDDAFCSLVYMSGRSSDDVLWDATKDRGDMVASSILKIISGNQMNHARNKIRKGKGEADASGRLIDAGYDFDSYTE